MTFGKWHKALTGPQKLCDCDRAVIIAMASVLMMQVAIDEIIDMIAVRNGGVTTVLTMDVISRMTGADMA